MIVDLKDPLILKMVSKFQMPERNYDSEKKVWVATGNKKDFFEYSLGDESNEKLVLVSQTDFTSLELKRVKVTLTIENDSFKKNLIKVKLWNLEKA